MRFFCMISQAPGLIFPLKIEPLFFTAMYSGRTLRLDKYARPPEASRGQRPGQRFAPAAAAWQRGEPPPHQPAGSPCRLQQDCRVEDAAGSLIAGCTSLADILLFGRPDRLPRPGGLAPARQSDGKRYHPILALCGDAAPVQDDDLLGNGQPQPRAPGA